MLYAEQKYEASIEAALLAIAKQSECEGAHEVLGRSYFSSGRYEDAARLAETAVEIVSNDYNALVPLINSLERLGRMADAEKLRRREMEVLQDQLQHFPDDVRARILLAADLAIFGDAAGAAMQVRIAVAMRPDGRVDSVQRGMHLRAAGHEGRGPGRVPPLRGVRIFEYRLVPARSGFEDSVRRPGV